MIRDIVWQTGQRFVAGFDGTVIPEEFKTLVRQYKVGNVILFKRNVESVQQLTQLCSDLQELIQQETGLPAFITIDQEGGLVTRLPEECALTPGNMALASTGNVENAYLAGVITGRELNAIGVNFNLAPVLDVNSNPRNPSIGVRSFGDQPETAAAYGCAIIRGFQENVLCSAKHFPGHGDTDVDSHLGLPMVEKTLEELENCELIPFKAAVEAGVDAITTSHILFPNIEKEHVPATMSKTILQGVLRKKLGFRGMIVSDCMMMDAIAKFYGTVAGSVTAANAGVDLICVCHDPVLAGQACAELAAKADPEMMESCVERIVAAKEVLMKRARQPLITATDPDALRMVREMRAAAVCLVGADELPPLGDQPFFAGCYPFQDSLAVDSLHRAAGFADYMQQELGGKALLTPVMPEEQDIRQAAAAAQDATCIVLCTYNAYLRRAQIDLMRELAALGKPMIVCAMGSPYDLRDLPEGACGLTAFEYKAETLQILRDVLTGAYKPAGMLSVKL